MFGDIEHPVAGVEYKKMGDLATYVNGCAFRPEEWGNVGLPIVRIQNLTGTSDEFNYFNGDYPHKAELKNGDVLISWSASLGVYLWNGGKAILNQHIFKVEFDKVPILKQFFMYAVGYKLDEMCGLSHGSTMKHIVRKDFDNTRIAYPRMDLQERFASLVQQSDKSKFTFPMVLRYTHYGYSKLSNYVA